MRFNIFDRTHPKNAGAAPKSAAEAREELAGCVTCVIDHNSPMPCGTGNRDMSFLTAKATAQLGTLFDLNNGTHHASLKRNLEDGNLLLDENTMPEVRRAVAKGNFIGYADFLAAHYAETNGRLYDLKEGDNLDKLIAKIGGHTGYKILDGEREKVIEELTAAVWEGGVVGLIRHGKSKNNNFNLTNPENEDWMRKAVGRPRPNSVLPMDNKALMLRVTAVLNGPR
jgi:hypothetical protein